MRVCELREKEVINVCNCKRLGNPVDVSRQSSFRGREKSVVF